VGSRLGGALGFKGSNVCLASSRSTRAEARGSFRAIKDLAGPKKTIIKIVL